MKKTTLILLSLVSVVMFACSESSVKNTKQETAMALVSDTGKKSKTYTTQVKMPVVQKEAVAPVIDHDKVEKTTVIYTGLLDDDTAGATDEQKAAAVRARGVWWNAPSLDFKKAIVAAINHKLNTDGRSSTALTSPCGYGSASTDGPISSVNPEKTNCLPANAVLNDAQIKYILQFQGMLPLTYAVNLDTLDKKDLEVLKSMPNIKKIGFISANALNNEMKGQISGNVSQRIINYLPSSLLGIYIDGVKLTATDLRNITSLKSIHIIVKKGRDISSQKTNVNNILLPPGAGFGGSSDGDSSGG